MQTKILQILQMAAMAVLILPGLAFAGVPYPDAATPSSRSRPAQRAVGSNADFGHYRPQLAESERCREPAEVAQHTRRSSVPPVSYRRAVRGPLCARATPTWRKLSRACPKYGLTAERTTATTLKSDRPARRSGARLCREPAQLQRCRAWQRRRLHLPCAAQPARRFPPKFQRRSRRSGSR